jgi:hypothetical protein
LDEAHAIAVAGHEIFDKPRQGLGIVRRPINCVAGVWPSPRRGAVEHGDNRYLVAHQRIDNRVGLFPDKSTSLGFNFRPRKTLPHSTKARQVKTFRRGWQLARRVIPQFNVRRQIAPRELLDEWYFSASFDAAM